MTGSAEPIYAFEGFHLDAQRRVLSRAGGEPIPLAPKVFDTLLYFVEHRGELLDKRGLLEAIWPHVIVEENNLNQSISTLRRVLGERPGEHRFIVTEPGRGYRFVATVSTLPEASEPAPELEAGPVVADREPDGVSAKKRPGRIYVATALLLILVLGGLLWYLPQDDDAVLPNSIAVLPFENLSPDPDDAYFATGLHEEILNQLTKISALNVIGRASVLRYAETEKSIREIAAEMNVETVLEASVRYAGNRVRITPLLIEAATGKTLWSETYDRPFDDFFAIESDIAMKIANALEAEFSQAEQAGIETAPTKSPEAYKAYLRAQNAANQQNTSSAGLALTYLDEAISLDPEFALAHARKAQGYANLLISTFGVNAAESIGSTQAERIARESAERALQLDPSQWVAREALGRIHELTWRWTEALEEYDQAARVTPRGPQAYALLQAYMGKPEEILRLRREEIARDPLNVTAHFEFAVVNAYIGNADAAVASMREAVTLAPNSALMHIWLAHAEGMRGNTAVALSELGLAERLPNVYASSISIANLAYAYGQNGRPEDAARLRDKLPERAPDRRLDAGNWALAHLAVGDEKAAQASLETVVDKIDKGEPDAGYISLALIRANIYSDPVLNQPVFQRLRSQIRGR